jgi:hexosaminidase
MDAIKKAGGRKAAFTLSKISARYVRVIATNYGTIPAGKAGAGNPAWLFVDEIEVE